MIDLFVITDYVKPTTKAVGPKKQGYAPLDLYETDPIKMTMSIETIEDISKVAGSYSKTFRLPNTPRNNTFFKGTFNVNGTTFDATLKNPAYINAEGIFFSQGNIRLEAVYINQETGKVEYEISYLGETNDFVSGIGLAKLSTLDLTALNHQQSYSNLTTSWLADGATAGLLEGNVIYPLIEWGYDYDKDGWPEQNMINEGVTATAGVDHRGSFTIGATYGIAQNQMKPACRIKYLWDKIFEDGGYTYESDFLTGSTSHGFNFNDLYFVGDSTDDVVLSNNRGWVIYGGSGVITALPLGTKIYEFNMVLDFFDPSNNFIFDYGNVCEYVAPLTGNYDVGASVNSTYVGLDEDPPSDTGTLKIINVVTGQVVAFIGEAMESANDGIQEIVQTTVALTKDDRLALIYEANFSKPPETHGHVILSNGRFEVYESPEFVNVASILPTTVTKVDFIKSIITKFRLVFEPDKNVSNHFIIEPWKDWIFDGTAKDWTDKLVGDKDLKIEPLFNSQKRVMDFTDAKDTDYVNTLFDETFKRGYGAIKQDSGIEVLIGETKVDTLFAPTPLASIFSYTGLTANSEFVIPHLCKDEDAFTLPITAKPIIPTPRILFYNGLVDCRTWYLLNDTEVGQAQSSYPLVSNFESFGATGPDSDSFNINWFNDYPMWNEEPDFTVGTSSTAYSEFWETWFNSTYDPYARIATGYFWLKTHDVNSLRFNDQIWIKDSMWYVTKIHDFALDGSSPTKVTLVKRENLHDVPTTVEGIGVTGPDDLCPTCKTYDFYVTSSKITISYTDCSTGKSVTANPDPRAQKIYRFCSCTYPILWSPYDINYDPFTVVDATGCNLGIAENRIQPVGPTCSIDCTEYSVFNPGNTASSFSYMDCEDSEIFTVTQELNEFSNFKTCEAPTVLSGTPDVVDIGVVTSPTAGDAYLNFSLMENDDSGTSWDVTIVAYGTSSLGDTERYSDIIGEECTVIPCVSKLTFANNERARFDVTTDLLYENWTEATLYLYADKILQKSFKLVEGETFSFTTKDVVGNKDYELHLQIIGEAAP